MFFLEKLWTVRPEIISTSEDMAIDILMTLLGGCHIFLIRRVLVFYLRGTKSIMHTVLRNPLLSKQFVLFFSRFFCCVVATGVDMLYCSSSGGCGGD